MTPACGNAIAADAPSGPSRGVRWRRAGGAVLGGLLLSLGALVLWGWLQEPAEPVHEGRPLSRWLDDLVSPAEDRRQAATLALQEVGTNSIPFLLRQLDVRDPRFGPAATASRKYLPQQIWVWLMQMVRPQVGIERRWPATAALALLGPAAAPAVPALGRALQDPEPRVRAAAMEALRQAGPTGIEALVQAMPAADLTMLHQLGSAVFRAGPAAAGSAAALVRLLVDGDVVARSPVVHALKGMDGAAVPPLAECFRRPETAVQEIAGETLAALVADNYPTLQAVLGLLRQPDPAIRRGAVQALSTETHWTRSSVRGLCMGLADPEATVRRAALAGLVRMAEWTDHVTNALAAVRELTASATGEERREAQVAERTLEARWPSKDGGPP